MFADFNSYSVSLVLVVLCVFTVMAMPINTKTESSDDLLMNLKRGLLSADSVLVSKLHNLLYWINVGLFPLLQYNTQ